MQFDTRDPVQRFGRIAVNTDTHTRTDGRIPAGRIPFETYSYKLMMYAHVTASSITLRLYLLYLTFKTHAHKQRNRYLLLTDIYLKTIPLIL